jgi:heat shock protein HtpX
MIYSRIEQNKRRSALFVFLMFVLLGALGYAVGEFTGVGYYLPVIAVVFAAISSVLSYYYGDRLVLAMSHARPAEKPEDAEVMNAVEGLAIAAGMPAPHVYIIDDTAPNAFATGRDAQHASLAVTSGLIQKMDRSELEGVIAHEMSHIANRDVLYMTLVAILAGAVILLADWSRRWLWWGGRVRGRRSSGAGIIALVAILLMILAPIFAALIQLAISRQREFLADAGSAKLTRYPDGLARALEKIAADPEPLEVANKATAHMYIYNPLRDHGGWLNSLFSTHPPIEERVARLRSM